MSKLKANLPDIGLLWLRVLMGSGMAYHGYGKVFGGNIDGLIKGVASMGFPAPELFAWAAAISELVGGALIVIGLFTKPAAAFVFITMTVAAFITHKADPFAVKELALAYWTMSGALICLGAGQFTVGNVLKK